MLNVKKLLALAVIAAFGMNSTRVIRPANGTTTPVNSSAVPAVPCASMVTAKGKPLPASSCREDISFASQDPVDAERREPRRDPRPEGLRAVHRRGSRRGTRRAERHGVGTGVVAHLRNQNTLLREQRGELVQRSEEHTSELQSLAYLVC